MTRPEAVVIHTDGASRGNPGPAAIGVVIAEPSGRVLVEFGEALPPTTNNVAEYTAVIRALERARELGARRVQFLMDSQLIVRQLNGAYRVKHPGMLPLYRRVLDLVQAFDDVSFAHVPREQNAEADRLANAALDEDIETPERVVSGFFRSLLERRWEDARARMQDSFRYRRASQREELDADRFMDWWKEGRARAWISGGAWSLGLDVLLEFSDAEAVRAIAGLWICHISAGKLESVREYLDTGN